MSACIMYSGRTMTNIEALSPAVSALSIVMKGSTLLQKLIIRSIGLLVLILIYTFIVKYYSYYVPCPTEVCGQVFTE